MYLFLDTETNGLDAVSRRSVQIAWLLTDASGKILQEASHFVRADDFEIGAGAFGVHGISKERTLRLGKPIAEVLASFKEALRRSDVLIGHNIKFDIGTLQNDINAANLNFSLEAFPQICTMRASTEWCRLTKLNGKSGFKYPKLIELYRICFGVNFNGEHDALEDARATFKCFFNLVEKGVIEVPRKRIHREQDKAHTDSLKKVKEKNVARSSDEIKKPQQGLNRKMTCTSRCPTCKAFFKADLSALVKFTKCPKCLNFVQIKARLVNFNSK